MSRPIEQALNNLIPRHPGSLPQELIQLASSLLAQSRNKASNLKAEEEIGRTYACANIACERLKTTLNLPPIEPRPPIAPRAYKKLYTYLEQTLTIGTPRKRTRNPHSPIPGNDSQRALPQRHTPSKEKSLEGFRASNRNERKGLQYASNKEKDDRVPDWVAPVVRMLCRDMTTRNAIPHLLAGVESVLCLQSPSQDVTKGTSKNEDSSIQSNIPALIAAVWFFVSSKMIGKQMSGDKVLRRRKLLIEALREARQDEGIISKVGESEEAWREWRNPVDGDVTTCIKQLGDEGWLDLDWFLNVEEVGDGLNIDTDIEVNEAEWVSKKDTDQLERAGLGSMKLEKFNYLTEAKRKEYKRWESAMNLKIDDLIAAGALDDDVNLDADQMDTREG